LAAEQFIHGFNPRSLGPMVRMVGNTHTLDNNNDNNGNDDHNISDTFPAMSHDRGGPD
jgi:hypothetical protein